MPETFRHLHRVTYSECTIGNHIYYARYLDILEEARGEFMRQTTVTAWQMQEQDMIFPVVEAHLRYRAPARYDDLLTVELWLTELGRVRVNFAYKIFNQHGALLLEADTCHVCTGLNEKPKRAPAAVVESLGRFLAEKA